MSSKALCFTVALLSAGVAYAQLDVGSDGSDGVFAPGTDLEVDLGLATTAAWDTPSPQPGNGVYDPDQWAVVFKYSSVSIPAGVTVTFKNHPSRAPVIWLVDGIATIDGTINLNGASGHTPSAAHSPSEPGPGGFRGGRARDTSSGRSGGLGPGGGDLGTDGNGSGGSYATQGSGDAAGPAYGNVAILPLIGGSGGAGANSASAGNGGGAGGGAILIAADGSISLGGTGTILARGGYSGGQSLWSEAGGGGSGGGIRLVADQITLDGALRAERGGGGRPGGDGRIRVEGNAVTFADPGDPQLVQDLPGFIFPPSTAPRLWATTLDAQAVPGDPRGAINDAFGTDVVLDTIDPVMLEIQAEYVPLGTVVEVRVVSKSGPTTVYSSNPLAGALESSTAAAQVQFEPGFSLVQLRAFFDPIPIESGPEAIQTQSMKLPKRPQELRALNGERIERVIMASVGRQTQLVYVTAKGRKIPVGARW
ncbi:MAG: hypothetical protein JXA69_08225 [Phycisphaerae bacterium]|nr:hypothetical protein [Phycisphaerae bacterium]